MSPARFDIIVSELRPAWVARMRNMLGQIGKRSILLWFSREELTDQSWQTREKPLSIDPLFITKTMMDGLSDLVLSTVVARPSDVALRQGTTGMYFPMMQAKAAADMLSVNSHIEASAKLVLKIRDGLSTLYKMYDDHLIHSKHKRPTMVAGLFKSNWRFSSVLKSIQVQLQTSQQPNHNRQLGRLALLRLC